MGVAAGEIPVDAKGLPLWQARIFDDFPIRIELEGPADLAAFLARVPIADFDREQVRVGADGRRLVVETRVTASEAEALARAGAAFTRVPDGEQEVRRAMEDAWAEQAAAGGDRLRLGERGVYHTYAQIGAILQQTAADHPAIAAAGSMGWSVLGRELWTIRISDNVGVEEAEPEVRLSSTMHGNEPPGLEMLLYLVDYLTDNYGTNADVTWVVDNFEIHILPCHNPDGLVAGTRRNAHSIDLNRNFPVPDGSIGDDGTWTEEPETVAFKNYGFAHHFVVSENGHSGALVVNYVWDHTAALAPDNDAIVNLSLEYSRYNLPMYNGAFPQGITNGYAWYEVNGSLQDWSYEETGCIDDTIEYSNNYAPPASQLDQLWNENRESFMHYIRAARYGVIGIVTASDTGLPLAATVTVGGIAKPVTTDPDFGDYYKLLATVIYDVTFTAPGYAVTTVHGVSVAWGTPAVLDVALDPVVEVVLAADDLEGGAGQWTGGWGLTTAQYRSPTHSMTDSPAGNYPSQSNNPCAMAAAVDLTGFVSASLGFWARWDIELDRDCCLLQVSADGGASWQAAATERTVPGSGQGAQPAGAPLFEGAQAAWVENHLDLAPWLGRSAVRIRFLLLSDGSVQRDGFYFDDVVVRAQRLTTGIREVGGRVAGAPARLLACSPNPASTGSAVRFAIGEAESVRLTVYDAAGRAVRALVVGELGAGEHVAEWDGRTAGGASAPSGVYWVRLAAGGRGDALRLVLVR